MNPFKKESLTVFSLLALLAVLIAAAVYVVNREKLDLTFATTFADWTAIGIQDFNLQTVFIAGIGRSAPCTRFIFSERFVNQTDVAFS